jgi:tetratricopeptide (TPR) repeat protein
MSWLKKLFPGGRGAGFPGRLRLFPEWLRLTRQQMDLLWMDRGELAALKAALENPGVPASDPRENGGVSKQPVEVTIEDVRWAEKVMTIAEQAAAASHRKEYAKAIDLYTKALKQAPDCDLYLMSIGACYANMGRPSRGLPYLKRAAKISPDNARIQHNLAAVKQMRRK